MEFGGDDWKSLGKLFPNHDYTITPKFEEIVTNQQ